MTNNKKILVLVLCSRNYLSKISSSSQRDIWGKYEKKIKFFHFVGKVDKKNGEVNYINKNNESYLLLNVDDGYSSIAQKTLLALEDVYSRFDFDFIFRTNTSSYINVNRLEKFISDNEKILEYCGKKLITENGDTIASGAGFFLSRKNVELLLKKRNYFEESLPDDVAIARLLKRFNIHPNESPRTDLKGVPSPTDAYYGNDFHYRCRLDPNYHRILEPKLMSYLEKATNKNNFLVYLEYYFLKLLFVSTNLKLVNKVIQKYYSYKFYGEMQLGNKLIYKKNNKGYFK